MIAKSRSPANKKINYKNDYKNEYLIRINFGAKKIWRNWHKMAKIRAKCNNFLALNPWRKNFFSNKKI